MEELLVYLPRETKAFLCVDLAHAPDPEALKALGNAWPELKTALDLPKPVREHFHWLLEYQVGKGFVALDQDQRCWLGVVLRPDAPTSDWLAEVQAACPSGVPMVRHQGGLTWGSGRYAWSIHLTGHLCLLGPAAAVSAGLRSEAEGSTVLTNPALVKARSRLPAATCTLGFADLQQWPVSCSWVACAGSAETLGVVAETVDPLLASLRSLPPPRSGRVARDLLPRRLPLVIGADVLRCLTLAQPLLKGAGPPWEALLAVRQLQPQELAVGVQPSGARAQALVALSLAAQGADRWVESWDQQVYQAVRAEASPLTRTTLTREGVLRHLYPELGESAGWISFAAPEPALVASLGPDSTALLDNLDSLSEKESIAPVVADLIESAAMVWLYVDCSELMARSQGRLAWLNLLPAELGLSWWNEGVDLRMQVNWR